MIYKYLVNALIFLIPCVSTPLEARPEKSQTIVEAIEFYTQFDEVLLLIQKKLSATHELARWMWNHGEPIENPEREQRMIDFALQCAECNQIPTAWAKWFVHTQLEAAKIVLKQNYETWAQEGQEAFTDVCDIALLHSYFIGITERIFVQLGQIFPSIKQYTGKDLPQPPLSHRNRDKLPEAAWKKAMDPFRPCDINPNG